MATQGKGILGAPHGKIGSIHFYNRLGKSIVQSNSIPSNAYDRYKNLWLSDLNDRMVTYYDFMNAAQKAQWDLLAPSGFSGREWFYNYTRQTIFNAKDDNESGSHYYGNSTVGTPELFTKFDTTTRNLYIYISDQSNYWTELGLYRVVLIRYFENGTNSNVSYNVSSGKKETIILTSVFPDGANILYLAIELRHYSPNIRWNKVLSNAYLNPKF